MRHLMTRSRRGIVRWALLALLALPSLGAPPATADDLGPAEAQYRAYLRRPSLYKRTIGRVKLAQTGLPGALALLTEDYMRPEDPKDQVRYLIATIATENFGKTAEMAPLFAAWRARALEPLHAWLWYRSLIVDRNLSGTAILETARSAAQPAVLRAAALRGLATLGDPESPAVVADVLAALPTTEPDRTLLIEVCSAVARTWAPNVKDAKARASIEILANDLDDKKLTTDTKDILARNLAGLFGTDVMTGGSAPWIRELKGSETRPEGYVAPETQYAPGPFFGLRAIGRRLVYVIDTSDSMLTRISPEEAKRIAPPVTTEGDGPLKKKPDAKANPDADLPWKKIHCRFDAAREVLKTALRALKPDQFVCVILFGDDARPLPSTMGLKPAEPKLIEAAIAELDKITPVPTPDDKSRPYGKLRGETNLHGALRLAFRVTTASKLAIGEYVDLSKTGCDTVLVLSDGNPTEDDFLKNDKNDQGDKIVKDRETMVPVADQPTANFPGPYGHVPFPADNFNYLIDDVRRMNLLRQAEIHCVGIGEVDDALLQAIAEIGGGRFRRVGEAASGAAPAGGGK